MPTPNELTYFPVTGYFNTAIGGSLETFDTTVVFTPRVPPGFTALISDLDLGNSNSGSSALAFPPVVVATNSGVLSTELLSNSAPVAEALAAAGITQLIYDVQFTKITLGYQIENFSIVASADATPVCITDPGLARAQYGGTVPVFSLPAGITPFGVSLLGAATAVDAEVLLEFEIDGGDASSIYDGLVLDGGNAQTDAPPDPPVTRIRQRHDTAINWATINPILYPGEVGYDTDTDEFKIGDGSSPWNSLTSWSKNASTAVVPKPVSIGDLGYGTSLLTQATSTVGTSKMIFTVGVAATNISVMWEHWYTQVASNPKTDTDPSGPITFNASLEVISSSNPGTVTGKLYPLNFNARISATLDPGCSVASAPLGLSLMPGDVVAVRTFLSSGTAYSPRFTYGATASGDGGFTATTDLTAPGSAAVASTNGYYYGPSALLGNAAGGSTAKSVLLLGDSIAAAIGDTAVYTKPAIGVGGFVQRALTGVAGLLSLAVGGDLANYFQRTDGSFRRLTNANLANSFILEYGTNDKEQGFSAAEIEGVQLNLATDLRRLGLSSGFITTLIPRTTSTDNWATTANQTPLATESVRLAYNAWVRAQCPIDPTTLAPVAVGTTGALLAGNFNHPLTGFFDTAARVESSLNSGFWLPANRVATGSIASGTNVLTSSDAHFLSASQEAGGDLGAAIMIPGAGVSGVTLEGIVGTVSSSTQVLIGGLSSATLSSAPIIVGVTTGDGIHPSPRGHNLMSQAIDPARL